MAANPYEPSNTTETRRRRSSLGYFVAAGLLFAIAIAIGSPGVALLNRQPVPGRYATYDPGFLLFGQSVSDTTLMNWSIGLGSIILFTAIAMLVLAVRARISPRR